MEQLEKTRAARPAEIAKSIDASNSQVSGLIAKLRKDKLVVKRGKGYRLDERGQGIRGQIAARGALTIRRAANPRLWESVARSVWARRRVPAD